MTNEHLAGSKCHSLFLQFYPISTRQYDRFRFKGALHDVYEKQIYNEKGESFRYNLYLVTVFNFLLLINASLSVSILAKAKSVNFVMLGFLFK